MKKETAIRLALTEAMDKDDVGKLIPSSLYSDDIHSDGNFETIYSIASMYSDDENDDGTWHKAILDMLFDEYPTYT